MKFRFGISAFLIVVIVTQFCGTCSAYSVLTHEEIIDIVWLSDIQPLLLERYPASTPAELKEAHAYAYGGSVIQDLGYYPFGSREFSNLLHYVRSGVFVQSLLQNSQNVNDYAFALGALAHYVSDTEGHPAVNSAVAIEYPKLAKKFKTHSLTYFQDRSAHLETEFGFDMTQVAKGRYNDQNYHDFIGFKVAKPLLERTFQQVYGIPLKDVLEHEDLTIGSYRRSVSKFLPALTKAALLDRKDEVTHEIPDFAKKKFLYNLSRADYVREWGNNFQRPGVGARILAFFLRLVPKIGPFRALAFKSPTPKTEDLYFRSVDHTVTIYRRALHELADRQFTLPNRDFDTGKLSTAGEYELADESYGNLLKRLSKEKFVGVTPPIKTDILAFYGGPSAAASNEPKRQKKRTQRELQELSQFQPNSANSPSGAEAAASTAHSEN